MEVGARIIELREKWNYTTNRLANMCGLSQSFIRSVEQNEKGISVEKLKLVCDSLGISLRDFFDVPDAAATAEDALVHKCGSWLPSSRKRCPNF